jgi:hypothetical protein
VTTKQKALVWYWLAGAVVVAVLFLLSNRNDFKLILLLALPFILLIEKVLKPARPEGTPTPVEIIKNSSGWSLFFGIYMLCASSLALVSVTVGSVGSWFSDNPWVVFPLLLLPLSGPILQSEIALYKAYGEIEP